jgi:hypothetical protein
MKLTQRYVDEVASYLPQRLQEDVSKELQSRLEEALDDRMASGSWDSVDQAEIALLEEFGPPHQLAESYLPGPQILFGPRLYPAFISTMKISISILAAVVALGLAVDFTHMSSATEFWVSLGDSVQSLLVGSLFLLGSVVTIFAIIERTSGESPQCSEAWDPTTLGDVEDAEKVSLGEVVVGIAFLVLALVMLNVFPDRIAIWVIPSEGRGTVPILTQAFWSQLWLLNVCLGLDLALSVTLLRRKSWTPPLLWTRVVITLLYVVWYSRLIYGPPIFGLDTEPLLETDWASSAVDRLESIVQGTILPILNVLLRIGFGAAVIGFCIRVYNTTKRTLALRDRET